MAKKTLNEKLLILAKAEGLTQTEIANSVDMQLSHINRYFNGKSDLVSSHLLNILKLLDIDVDEIVSKRIRDLAGSEDSGVDDLAGSINYLLGSLDEIGRQTMLQQMLWAAEKTSKTKIPEKVVSIVRKEISRI